MAQGDEKVNKRRRKGDITIKELPTYERPREKLIRYGPEALSNSELLAILIGTGMKNTSALTLASQILALSEEGISYLVDASPEELSKVQGIGIAKSCQIISAIELGKRISQTPRNKRISISTPEELAALYMEELRYRKKEIFKVIYLNTKNEITFTEDISIGNLNSSIVHPREVFRSAVKRGAASIIVIHNHPSGNPTPSQNDINVTKRLVEVGELIGIPVLDHLIIGDGVFISLKEKMLI